MSLFVADEVPVQAKFTRIILLSLANLSQLTLYSCLRIYMLFYMTLMFSFNGFPDCIVSYYNYAARVYSYLHFSPFYCPCFIYLYLLNSLCPYCGYKVRTTFSKYANFIAHFFRFFVYISCSGYLDAVFTWERDLLTVVTYVTYLVMKDRHDCLL